MPFMVSKIAKFRILCYVNGEKKKVFNNTRADCFQIFYDYKKQYFYMKSKMQCILL